MRATMDAEQVLSDKEVKDAVKRAEKALEEAV